MFVHELEINENKKQPLTEAVFASANHIAWLPKWITAEEQNHSEIESDGQAQDHQ